MFSRCDNDNKRPGPLEAEVDRDLSDSRQIRGSSECLAEHKFKPVASTVGSNDQADQSPPLHPVFQVICPEMEIENTYDSSHWRETIQLLTMFQVICQAR